MHDDRPALQEPVGQGVAAPPPDRDREIRIIGQRGPHDRHRKAVLPVRPHQAVLAGDLVAGVVPERIAEGRGFRDEVVRGRLLIGGGRADEHELPGPATEQGQVPLDILRRVGDPVHNRIERQVPQDAADLLLAVHICGQAMAAGQVCGPLPAVEQVELNAPGNRLPADRRADEARSADEEDSHGTSLYRTWDEGQVNVGPRPDVFKGRQGLGLRRSVHRARQVTAMGF